MYHHMLRRFALTLIAIAPVFLSARQLPTAPPATAPDMIDRIFASREFAPRALPAPEWFDGGASYLLIEPETPASE